MRNSIYMKIVKKSLTTITESIDVSRAIKNAKRFSSANTAAVLSAHCPVEGAIGTIVHSASTHGMLMSERREIAWVLVAPQWSQLDVFSVQRANMSSYIAAWAANLSALIALLRTMISTSFYHYQNCHHVPVARWKPRNGRCGWRNKSSSGLRMK